MLNRGGKNHWLTLQLVGVHSNRDGMGAKIKIGKQWVYATTSGSYLSASDGQVHFGLGSDKEATVEIVWPSGAKQVLEKIAADRIVTVKEPE
jgi:Tfp pilus assembly protein PilP